MTDICHKENISPVENGSRVCSALPDSVEPDQGGAREGSDCDGGESLPAAASIQPPQFGDHNSHGVW